MFLWRRWTILLRVYRYLDIGITRRIYRSGISAAGARADTGIKGIGRRIVFVVSGCAHCRRLKGIVSLYRWGFKWIRSVLPDRLGGERGE